MKNATRPNLPGKDYIKKSRQALSKFQAVEKNFRNKEKRIRTDLEKARKIWGKVGERFSWWQSLP